MNLASEFSFDAAHRLLYHEGACKHVHGHTWKVRVVVSGPVDAKTGMIIDFKDLKAALRARIFDLVDHSLILNEDDEKLADAIKAVLPEQRLVKIVGEPTCENLARLFYLRLYNFPQFGLKVESVEVWESPTTSAIYEGGL